MEFQGILTQSLGNFWCLRGYARLGDLAKVSKADPAFQRDLLREHRDEIVKFLSERRFLFFPEVVLGADLSIGGGEAETLDDRLNPFLRGEDSEGRKLTGRGKNLLTVAGYHLQKLSDVANVTAEDARAGARREALVRLTLNEEELERGALAALSRVDGNHRLSAVGLEDHAEFADIVCPFCIVLFRNRTDADLYNRAIFHNVNAKSIPLRTEQNLKLILDHPQLFPDDDLQKSSSFGWAYYLARKICARGREIFEFLPALREPLRNPSWNPDLGEENEFDIRHALLQTIELLLKADILIPDEDAIEKLKKALTSVNAIYSDHPNLQIGRNSALFSVLMAYQLKAPKLTRVVVNWALSNGMQNLRGVDASSLFQIVDSILSTRNRKVFISMPFGRADTDGHWEAIKEICSDLSRELGIDPPIEPKRVDIETKGMAHDINHMILEMIDGASLLIANLTYSRPNVYHEIGLVMGKMKAMGLPFAQSLILILDTSVPEDERRVGFNLNGMTRIEFNTVAALKPQLKTALAAALFPDRVLAAL